MNEILKEILSVLEELLNEARVHNTAEMRDNEDNGSYDEGFSFRSRKWHKDDTRYGDIYCYLARWWHGGKSPRLSKLRKTFPSISSDELHSAAEANASGVKLVWCDKENDYLVTFSE